MIAVEKPVPENYLNLTKEQLVEKLISAKEENRKLNKIIVTGISSDTALNKITAKLKAVFENKSQSYLLIDSQYKIKAFNNAVNKRVKIYFKKKIQQGCSVFDFIREEDFSDFKENLIKAFEGKYTNNSGFKYKIKNRISWYEFHYVPVILDNGKVEEVFINIQDVTQRKFVEEELRQSEERIRAILEAIPDIVVRFEETGKIIDFHSTRSNNPIFNTKEVIGENIFSLFTGNLQKGLDYYLEKAKTEHNIQRIEYKFNKRNYIHYEEARLVPIENKQFLMILRDVTKRKEAESQLKRFINELQANQAELKSKSEKLKFVNHKLAQSEEKLRELNQNKDKFFSIIAHDLKNSFYVLSGYTELLYDEVDDLTREKIKDFTKKIDESTKNTLTLLNNLLEWAKIQRDSIIFEPIKLNPSDLIDESIYRSKIFADKKNITLIKNCSNKLEVAADENMVLTILRNLISNAIKFTPSGGKVIVFTETFENNIKFGVKDNGVGMSPEIIQKLFKIEKNVSTFGTNNEKGTGLGLLLCKEFVEKHNGKIWVESKQEEGSTFYFTISTVK